MNSCCTYYIASSITAVNGARGTLGGVSIGGRSLQLQHWFRLGNAQNSLLFL